MSELVITYNSGRTAHLTLGDRPLVIGRDLTCDLTIDDPSASRRHARFFKTPIGYILEDLGSKNGTMVNDETCGRHLLKDGDRALIGSTVAVFHDKDTSPLDGSLGANVLVADDEATGRATRYVGRDRELLIPQQRLKVIYDLSETLTRAQPRDTLLSDALQICFDNLKFERGAIGLRNLGQRSVEWPIVRNLRGAEGGLRISRSLLNRALEHGERAIFAGDSASGADPTVSMVQEGIRSAMCVPLLEGDTTLGVIYGDRTTTSTIYSDEDSDFLAGIARQVAIGLINCRLVEEQKEMARLKQEIELARSIQTDLFPSELPNRKELKVAAINDPGQRVSGDYYDVLDAGDGRVWCLMADVTGEGIAAALLMANLQAAVRVTIDETDDPGTLLERWNTLICRNTEASKFITCALALIDPATGSVRVSSAGHCQPLVVRNDGSEPSELTVEPGYPLGVVDTARYGTETVELGPDPFVYLCYTDGVTEAMNAAQDHFGKERLIASLRDIKDLNPTPLVKQVRRAVSQFAEGAKQSDDITLLAARVM